MKRGCCNHFKVPKTNTKPSKRISWLATRLSFLFEFEISPPSCLEWIIKSVSHGGKYIRANQHGDQEAPWVRQVLDYGSILNKTVKWKEWGDNCILIVLSSDNEHLNLSLRKYYSVFSILFLNLALEQQVLQKLLISSGNGIGTRDR